LKEISTANTADAISIICSDNYAIYLHDNHIDTGKIELLSILAEQEPDINKFLERLKSLEKHLSKGVDSAEANAITLSTIHASKGLEYDTVYVADVFDGRFPSSKQNIFNFSKDTADGEQEERRLFYVAITRAKNSLNIIEIKDRPSSYIAELFPEVMEARRAEAAEKERQRQQAAYAAQMRRQAEEKERLEREKKKKEERDRKLREEKLRKEQEERQKEREAIEARIDQSKNIVRDHLGQRWARCKECGKVGPESEFQSLGGLGEDLNRGRCKECAKKRRG